MCFCHVVLWFGTLTLCSGATDDDPFVCASFYQFVTLNEVCRNYLRCSFVRLFVGIVRLEF